MNERDLFIAALQLDPKDRPGFFERECPHDPALRQRVEDLLAAHQQAGSAFGSSGATTAFPRQPSDQPAHAQTREVVGTTIAGRYNLLQEIGEGGMGTVWLAEQRAPVRRKVALKLIKVGMDSRMVLARFEAERQALALMDHPNIAKVLDGGLTGSGRPYFVMDYVKGMPITEYCDLARLSIDDRMKLFVQVCSAVQHAHQKGIIHRDLKPSNILVAPYDDQPVPKVIDFGLAKAMHQPLTERTVFTAHEMVMGTPLYMSPEQAQLNNLDIDTRSDIYSLGVLLYELLTGTTPLERKRFEEAAWDEIRRVIREEEPPRPSTRLSSTATLASVARCRQTEPATLTRRVRGELDWIVMRALEKDRARRYESASSLATDVQRYLSNEPVQACPPTAWYRLRKLARRNRRRLVGAGILGLALAIATGGVGWAALDRAARQTRAANDLERALDRAEFFEGQGQRAEALAAVDRAELLAGQAAPDPARHERLAAVKKRLDAQARDQEFIARFEEIRLRVQGHVEADKGYFSQEAAFHETRDALRQYVIAIGVMAPAQAAVHVQGRPEPVRRGLVAALTVCLAWAPRDDSMARRWLLATLDAVDAADNDTWRVRARRAVADGDHKAVEQLAREADVREQPPSFLLHVAGSFPAEMRSSQIELLRRTQRAYPSDLWANHDLAAALYLSGRPAEAVRYYTAALALRPDNAGIYLNRAVALDGAGEVDAAVADYRQSIALAPKYAGAHYDLGNTLIAKDQLDDAIAAYREAIRIKEDYAEAHINMGLLLMLKAQFPEALEEVRRGHELGSRKPGWPSQPLQWVRQCERLVELDGRLPGLLGGKTTPANPGERVDLALLCFCKQMHRAAVRFYEEAFAAKPKLANDLDPLDATYRYEAACAAALAGCGQGRDADTLDAAERDRLRRLARDWLRADLDEWGRRLDKESDVVRAEILRKVHRWLVDRNLASVRGPAALAKLPEAEREPWQQLWNEAAHFPCRAGDQTTSEEEPGVR